MAHPEYLGKYTIKTLLGEGAMGVVYKAYDPGIGRLVAIKTIRQALANERHAELSLIERFRNEARAVGRLSHPNIVAIYELGQTAEHAYIVMEYVEGRDLARILEATPKPPLVEVMAWMLALLDALEAAHRHGVWHRDIKPANLIISESGQLKVTDFGIARIESAALTQVSMVIGTPGFMAPEQYMGEAIDQRVDIFAAGVLLYRLLTGQMPFAGKPEAVMYAVINKTPAPLADCLSPELAAQFEPIVRRALAKAPDERYASAAAFADALRACAGGVPAPSDQNTVVMPRAVETPVMAVGPVDSTAATPLTHWDHASLAHVQVILARFVGPMAKVQVRQAAKRCTRLPELVDLLAQDIADPKQRAAFVEQMNIQSAATMLRPATAQVGAVASAPAATAGRPATALSEPLIALATQHMTRIMGPIAKIVVKKAAAKAQSAEAFVALLAQECETEAQRAQLLTALSQAATAPK